MKKVLSILALFFISTTFSFADSLEPQKIDALLKKAEAVNASFEENCKNIKKPNYEPKDEKVLKLWKKVCADIKATKWIKIL